MARRKTSRVSVDAEVSPDGVGLEVSAGDASEGSTEPEESEESVDDARMVYLSHSEPGPLAFAVGPDLVVVPEGNERAVDAEMWRAIQGKPGLMQLVTRGTLTVRQAVV